MDIAKVNEFYLLREIGQRRKIFHSENRRSELSQDTLKDLNVCECIIDLLFLNVSKEKMDQEISWFYGS